MESCGLKKGCSDKLGDGPYARAKHAQLVDKDGDAAIFWFRKAIEAGERVESAVKDMAAVLKQLGRTQEAIQALNTYRRLCPAYSQPSLDNILIDLYKKCGNFDQQIVLLKHKLKKIYLGEAFNGKTTKTARSHGKKFQVSVPRETSRILGNLAWAYMQKSNFMAAEVVYRKAQMINGDANKALNLCQCLIKQARWQDAHSVLDDVLQYRLPGSDDVKTRNRANVLAIELESNQPESPFLASPNFEEALERVINEWAPTRSRRLPIFEELSQHRDQLAC